MFMEGEVCVGWRAASPGEWEKVVVRTRHGYKPPV